MLYMLIMRDEKEERKKQARSNNTAHPRQSLFLRQMSCLRWDSKPRHSIYTLDRALYHAGWTQISHLIVHLMNRLTIMYMCMQTSSQDVVCESYMEMPLPPTR